MVSLKLWPFRMRSRRFRWYSVSSPVRGSTTKLTINNKRLNRQDFEQKILLPRQNDYLDGYRAEYNDSFRNSTRPNLSPMTK